MNQHAERSRQLLRASLPAPASLATLSQGYPYASLVHYGLDPQGQLLLLLSELAEHTQNLLLDPRASLLVAEASGDPMASARVTLVGRLVRAEAQLLSHYLDCQPQARAYAALKDFHLWMLQPQRIRFIAGFGEMSWVDLPSYLQAS